MSSILLAPLNFIAAIIELLFCIPVVGRFAKWSWNSLLTILHLLVGMLEYGLMCLGFQPPKKMRVNVVLFKDPNGKLLADKEEVFAQLQDAIELFQAAANIRLLPATGAKNQPDPDAPNSLDSDEWIYIPENPPDPRVLDVDCNCKAFAQDLWLPGTLFQFMTLSWSFPSNFRRVSGIGAPVTIFIVRGIKKFGGCSIGPFSDYVTVRHDRLNCIAHELGHSCNLLHSKDDTNLMYHIVSSNTHLTPWQVALLRASRHVTFF